MKCLSFHAVMLPKLENLHRFVEDALVEEDPPEHVKNNIRSTFFEILNDPRRFEVFVGVELLPYYDPQTKVADFDRFREDKKAVLENILSLPRPASAAVAWTMGLDPLKLREIADYKMWPDHQTKIRRYLNMFCDVYSQGIQQQQQ